LILFYKISSLGQIFFEILILPNNFFLKWGNFNFWVCSFVFGPQITKLKGILRNSKFKILNINCIRCIKLAKNFRFFFCRAVRRWENWGYSFPSITAPARHLALSLYEKITVRRKFWYKYEVTKSHQVTILHCTINLLPGTCFLTFNEKFDIQDEINFSLFWFHSLKEQRFSIKL
jgi:hypothetical protein